MLNDILIKAYKASKYTNVKEFHRQSKCSCSEESADRPLLRGIEPSFEIFIRIAYALEIPRNEMVEALKAAGDTFWWRIICPTSLNQEESELLARIHALDSKKMKMIKDMLDSWGV
jgi:hypothetical protein